MSSLSSSLRIIHATDIHFLCRPSIGDIIRSPSRLKGFAYFHILGHANQFSLDVQRQLVQQIVELKPDLVVLTGDLTNTSLHGEFALARAVLFPLLTSSSFPCFIIPGNHDAWTDESIADPRSPALRSSSDSGTRDVVSAPLMRQYLGPWMESMAEEEIEEGEYARRMVRAYRELPPREKKRRDSTSDDEKDTEEEEVQRVRDVIRRTQQHFMKFDDSAAAAAASSSVASAASSSSITASSSAAASSSPPPARPLTSLPIFSYSFLRLLGINPCRPVHQGAEYEEKQMDALKYVLRNAPESRDVVQEDVWKELEEGRDATAAASAEVAPSSSSVSAASSTSSPPLTFSSTYNLLLGHYPILGTSGRPSGGVANESMLRQILTEECIRARVHMYLHGHVHKGYQTKMWVKERSKKTDEEVDEEEKKKSSSSSPSSSTDHPLLIFNAGSGGQTNRAAFNLYTIAHEGPADVLLQSKKANKSSSSSSSSSSPSSSTSSLPPQSSADGLHRYSTAVTRFIHDGEMFVEQEQAYA